MKELGFKQLTPENWQEPDIPRHFPAMTEEIWIRTNLKPQLIERVPDDVRKLFEVARGSIIYGWFFYPLLTIGSEQCIRTLEAAVHHCCEKHGIPTETENDKGKKRPVKYANQIKKLVEKGIIPTAEELRWTGARDLRNSTSHPKMQLIFTPAHSITFLTLVSEDINLLFDGKKRNFAKT